MPELKGAYINELYKISKRKKVVTSAVLSIFAVLAAAVIVYCINNFAGIRITGSSEFPILVLSVLIYTLLPLFTAFVCIDMVSGEFSDQTIKTTLTTPASRLCVYSAKVLAAGTFILASLLFIMVLSILASFFVGNISASIFRVLTAYIVSALPLFVFALLVMLIGNITRGTTSTFMLSILVFLVFLGLGMAFPNFKSFLFTSAIDWYRLFLGSYINYGKAARVFFILAGYAIVLFSSGYILFEKRDI